VNPISHMVTNKPHLCFETLSNDLRIQILKGLKDGPLSVNELTEQIGLERSRISHSLKMLKDCKFVHAKKSGRQMLYSINEKAMSPDASHESIFHVINDHVKTFCMDGCHKESKRCS